jgi:hypothetical protein
MLSLVNDLLRDVDDTSRGDNATVTLTSTRSSDRTLNTQNIATFSTLLEVQS